MKHFSLSEGDKLGLVILSLLVVLGIFVAGLNYGLFDPAIALIDGISFSIGGF